MKFKGLSLFRALDLHAEGDREGSIVARIQHELNNATGKGN
jgi:hypothetical protein